jgi:hypothetical protein
MALYIKIYISINIYKYMLPFQMENKRPGDFPYSDPFTVHSSCKWKFFVCPFVYKETNGSYLFANGLDGLNVLKGLNGLAHLRKCTMISYLRCSKLLHLIKYIMILDELNH